MRPNSPDLHHLLANRIDEPVRHTTQPKRERSEASQVADFGLAHAVRVAEDSRDDVCQEEVRQTGIVAGQLLNISPGGGIDFIPERHVLASGSAFVLERPQVG